MASSHNPGVYRELLTRFRDGYAKYSTASLRLLGMTATEPEALPRGERECLLKELCCFSWPIGPKRLAEERRLWVWGSLAHPDDLERPEIRKLSREALECLGSLAARAGAHLPPSVRDSVLGAASSAEAGWYALLWWLPMLYHSDQRKIPGGTTISFSPFQDSARAIEVCGLAGDSPAFPARVSSTDEGDVVTEVEDLGRTVATPARPIGEPPVAAGASAGEQTGGQGQPEPAGKSETPEQAEPVAGDEGNELVPPAVSDEVTFLISEAADFVGVSDDTMRRWVRDGKIKSTDKGAGDFSFSNQELNVHKQRVSAKKVRLARKSP